MQTIGERLEEARKRKGISLREAAEATKIRSDFLSSIEQNKFDFDLPEIYKRGFLKNYARYLKLDVEKILTDYNAQLLSNTRLGKKAGAEWFGQMEVRKPEKTERPAPEENEKSPSSIFTPPGQTPEPYDAEEEHDKEEDNDKTFYLKIGLIFVGTLALVFVVFGLIWAILNSGGSDTTETPEEPELRDTQSVRDTLTGGDTAVVGPETITLSARNDVLVVVRQKNDGKELYKGTIAGGNSIDLEKVGPVDIAFTNGENLTIEARGERMRPGTSGAAKITIP